VISLDGEPTIIVGVMPPAFDYPRGRDVWVPRVPLGSETNARGSTYWQVVGKLRAGVTPERAQAEFDGIARRLADEYPTTNAGTGVALVRLTDHLVGDVRPALMLLWLGVGFVLLIACFNVANLLLARTMRRRRELALLGVMVGAGVAALASRLLSRFLYGIGPLDVPTFGGIAVLLLAVTALACWLPARRAARTDPMISLRAE
jgi:putative ABC transport system permease protein